MAVVAVVAVEGVKGGVVAGVKGGVQAPPDGTSATSPYGTSAAVAAATPPPCGSVGPARGVLPLGQAAAKGLIPHSVVLRPFSLYVFWDSPDELP